MLPNLPPVKALKQHTFTPLEETEHGTRPGGRGPGGVPGGVGSKNRGGGMCAYTEGLSGGERS